MEYPLLSNFEATAPPVDPSNLRVSGGRTIEYMGNTYKVQGIEPSTRKYKKYKANVLNTTTGESYSPHFGDVRYDDYYVHRDPVRRQNFKTRHAGIRLKDGTLAIEDPRQPAYYAYNANWSYMSDIANFKF